MIPDTWQKKELADLVTFKSGGTPAKSKEEYWNGDIPWISAKDMKSFWLTSSQSNISLLGAKNGTTIAAKGTLLILVRGMTLRKDVPVCVTSREMAFNQDVKGLVPKDINPIYLAYYLCSRKSQLLALVNEAGHGTGRLQTDFLESFPVLVPEVKEQDLIADLLVKWDRAIELKERLIAVKQERRTWLMQQLLSGKRRLKSFSNPWRTRHLDEVFVNRVETGFAHLPLVAITGENGVVSRGDLARRDTSSEDKSRYLRICPGDIGYNTMRMWQGVCGLSSIEGIVSPAYTIITPKDEVDGEFMSLLFKFSPVVHLLRRHSQGLVDDTLNLKWRHFAEIKVTIPEKAEQQAIAAVFRTTDRELDLLRAQLNALREQKKGLMQQLMTGKVRVKVPPSQEVY